MRKDLLPECLRNLEIRGAEDDSEEEEEENSDESEEESEDEEGEGKGKPENNDALKEALRKERRRAKNLERENKKLQRQTSEKQQQEQSEMDKAKDNASKAESRAQKLAEKLRDSAIDNAIIKAAQKMKFQDIDDALKLVDREDIDVEQDDEDPTDIQLDEGSVKAALETLAKNKPHLIVANGDGERSGGKFGGGRKSKQELDDAALMKGYSAFTLIGGNPPSQSS